MEPDVLTLHAGIGDIIGGVIGTGVNVLSGGLVGGLLRLAPEVLRLFTSKADRDHEYRMAKLAADTAAAERAGKLEEIRTEGAVAQDTKGLDALIEAVKGQGARAGVGWVDAISATVRPFVTYWWLSLYTAVKTCLMLVALRNGVGLADAVLQVWTEFDIATFGAIINFWFLDRVLKHRPL
jgi:hypothetical protein